MVTKCVESVLPSYCCCIFPFQNWLGYTKKRAPIGFHRVVEILHKNSAPVQVMAPKERWVQDPLGDLTFSLLLVSGGRRETGSGLILKIT